MLAEAGHALKHVGGVWGMIRMLGHAFTVFVSHEADACIIEGLEVRAGGILDAEAACTLAGPAQRPGCSGEEELVCIQVKQPTHASRSSKSQRGFRVELLPRGHLVQKWLKRAPASVQAALLLAQDIVGIGHDDALCPLVPLRRLPHAKCPQDVHSECWGRTRCARTQARLSDLYRRLLLRAVSGAVEEEQHQIEPHVQVPPHKGLQLLRRDPEQRRTNREHAGANSGFQGRALHERPEAITSRLRPGHGPRLVRG